MRATHAFCKWERNSFFSFFTKSAVVFSKKGAVIFSSDFFCFF